MQHQGAGILGIILEFCLPHVIKAKSYLLIKLYPETTYHFKYRGMDKLHILQIILK